METWQLLGKIRKIIAVVTVKKLDSFEEVKSKYLENLEMEIEFLQ